jgi:hypothetical protein
MSRIKAKNKNVLFDKNQKALISGYQRERDRERESGPKTNICV